MNNLQRSILKIYKEFKSICEENGLRYYAIGGTAIGAVRHKGFIPWDDDLDVAMPDNDYNRFISIVSKNDYFAKLVKPLDKKTDSHFFIKFEDPTTTFFEEAEIDEPEDYKGVYIDIMPLYGIPHNEIKKYIKYAKLFGNLHNKKRRKPNAVNSKLGWFSYILFLPINTFCQKDFWYRSWQRFFSKNAFDDSTYTGYCWSHKLREQTIFETAWFKTYIEVPFEDTTIRVPSGYDMMLTKQFGDYMVIPDVQHQKKHKGLVDVNRPYSYYQEEYNTNGFLKEFTE